MLIALIPPRPTDAGDCLRDVLFLSGAGGLFQQTLLNVERHKKAERAALYVPADWLDELDRSAMPIQGFGADGLSVDSLNGSAKDGVLIGNARRLYRYDPHKLHTLLDASRTAAAAVRMAPELVASNEPFRLTSRHHIVGVRRLFEDMIEPTFEDDSSFPDFLYLPPLIIGQIKKQGTIPLDLEVLEQRLADMRIPLRRFRLGGQGLDLNTVEGLLGLLERMDARRLNQTDASAAIASTARLGGPLWIGPEVQIEDHAVVLGPAILCKNVKIGKGAVVQNAILGPNTEVKADDVMQNTLCTSPNTRHQGSAAIDFSSIRRRQDEVFRNWPLWSYPRLGKRIFDMVFSLCILLLISPVLAIVSVMVKLTSSGPVFYRARRQGLHGKEFNCLKFRTMMVQADALQERLRVVNQVDGPQFKIDNDPRITGVGKFLRDTCIDELPQFFNVLTGQMSVVGPRPSPENENESCPAWRDARLSVRPGITGLWQVCRTRQEGQDFQEWVYYDTRYVRNLSFRQDLFICLKTAARLINNFLDQFG